MASDMKTGTVKWFRSKKGYGFIKPDGGVDGDGDVFVHYSAIKSPGYRSLAENEPVEYFLETDQNGRTIAVDVTGPNGSPVQGDGGRPKGGNYNAFGHGMRGGGRYGGAYQGGGGWFRGAYQGGGSMRGSGRYGDGGGYGAYNGLGVGDGNCCICSEFGHTARFCPKDRRSEGSW